MYASDDNWEEILLMDSITFASSSRKAEDGGFISFGNQDLRENILNCARY
jgi:hypothetical protein